MSSIAIIGAGISGPTAAIALAMAGHDVTVYEVRQDKELNSFGVIGITHDNWYHLTSRGVDPIEYGHGYTVYGGETSSWNGHYVEWSKLHNALVTRATELGVTFKFRTTYTPQPGYDWVIVAAGVGYAGKSGNHADYSGYVVYRGLTDKPAGYDWLSVPDSQKRWNFKLAETDHGSAWELYSHLSDPHPRGTTQITSVPSEAYDGLPAEFVSYITESAVTYRAAISDWDAGNVRQADGVLTIGDANGGMRPHTGMGANLGITEALATPDLVNGADLAESLQNAREAQRVRGIQMGRQALGS